MTQEEWAWLSDFGQRCGWASFKWLPARPGHYAAIMRLMFHWTLITGRIGDEISFDDRWCYRDDLSEVMAVMKAWDGSGEPSGWHRHPFSGRRVGTAGELVYQP